MNFECDELLTKPDNIEIIRDQIGAILSAELQNQFRLAIEAKAADAQDFNVAVYVENDDPIQFATAGVNPFPLVNVSLESTEKTDGSSNINKARMSASFLIDVYATGNADDAEEAASRASVKAWKAARLVRNIICAENYAYLKLRGIVEGRNVSRFESGSPANANSALRVKIVRITLTVDYVEGVAQSSGLPLEIIDGVITDENGKVVVGFEWME